MKLLKELRNMLKDVYAGAALKSWLREFFSSWLSPTQNSQDLGRAFIVAITKQMKPLGDPKSYQPLFLLCVSTKPSRGLSTPASNQLLIH